MKLWLPVTGAIGILLGGWMAATAGWSLPPVKTTQTGYRGTGMVLITDADRAKKLAALNVALPAPDPVSADGPRAKSLYPNLQLLGDLSEEQFNRLMASFAEWVGGEQGCAYCHNVENMADYSKYQMTVARRMIQMTRTVNSDWKAHVGATGVTCYTCHRGNPVPKNIWFVEKGPGEIKGNTGWMGYTNGQNLVSRNNGSTSLPYTALKDYLSGDRPIRVHTLTALPSGNKATIMDTESTYSLMVHMSNGLGVNCVFCHNSRAFNAWDQSPPQRVTAWHGIRMARALNKTFLEPLQSTYPPERLGSLLQDAPKANCTTCHQGQNKPLAGVSMLKDFQVELGGPNK